MELQEKKLIKTGFPPVDEYIQGINPGEVTLIAYNYNSYKDLFHIYLYRSFDKAFNIKRLVCGCKTNEGELVRWTNREAIIRGIKQPIVYAIEIISHYDMSKGFFSQKNYLSFVEKIRAEQSYGFVFHNINRNFGGDKNNPPVVAETHSDNVLLFSPHSRVTIKKAHNAPIGLTIGIFWG